MSAQADLKAVLAAVSSLSTFFTGGIITYADLREGGLTRKAYPAAFDANLLLKPTLVIKDRKQISTPELKGMREQITSARQAVELWYYHAPNGSFSDLETASATVYATIHDQPAINGRHYERRDSTTMDRERLLDNAPVALDVYDAIGLVTP